MKKDRAVVYKLQDNRKILKTCSRRRVLCYGRPYNVYVEGELVKAIWPDYKGDRSPIHGETAPVKVLVVRL